MLDTLFQQHYRIDSTRLGGYDYSSNSIYFITICTQNRTPSLGEIIVDQTGECIMQPNSIGQRVIEGWLSVTQYHPYVLLDAFQLMPNHLHGLLWICKPEEDDWRPNVFGPQRQNLPSIVRGFKSGVKTFATTQQINFAWQPRYYDRIVRNNDELNRIRDYIDANPANWHRDCNNVENLYM